MKRITALILICIMIMIPLDGPSVSFAGSDFPSFMNADTEMVRSGSGRWDIRIKARQKEYGYDTIQGACSYKGYAYMALYNRKVEKIKIAKVDLKTMKVVKVSKPLDTLVHGNTLTYNPKTNRIIAVCGVKAPRTVVFFSPKTMEMTSTRTIRLSTKQLGEKFEGINGFSYNEKRDMYVLKVRNKSSKIVLLDRELRVKKVISPEGVRTYLLAQGLYTEGDYMFDLQSFRYRNYYNLITVRKIDTGKLVGRIKVYSGDTGQLYELENLFHDNGKWYISYYRANVRSTGDTDRKNYLYIVRNMPDI